MLRTVRTLFILALVSAPVPAQTLEPSEAIAQAKVHQDVFQKIYERWWNARTEEERKQFHDQLLKELRAALSLFEKARNDTDDRAIMLARVTAGWYVHKLRLFELMARVFEQVCAYWDRHPPAADNAPDRYMVAQARERLATALAGVYKTKPELSIRTKALTELGRSAASLERVEASIDKNTACQLWKDIGACRWSFADWKGAVVAYEKVCAAIASTPSSKPTERREFMRYLAGARANAGEPDMALVVQLKILAECEKLANPGDELWGALWDVASTCGTLEKNKDAQVYWNRCREILKEQGKHELRNQATIIQVRSLNYLGRMELSEKLMRAVVDSYKDPEQKTHPTRLWAMRVLAATYHLKGEATKSRKISKELIEIWKDAKGPNSIEHYVALRDLGTTYGDTEEALDLAKRAQEGLEKLVPEDHIERLTAQWMRAKALMGLGQYPEALKHYKAVQTVYEKNIGLFWERWLNVRMQVAQIKRLQGYVDESITILKEGIEIFKKRHNIDEVRAHSYTHNVYAELAFSHRALGNYAAAIDLMDQAMTWRTELLDKDNYELQMTRDELARLMMACGDYKGAREILGMIVKSYENTIGDDAYSMQDARIKLAHCMWQQGEEGERKEAIRLTEQAIEKLERGPRDKARALQLARLSLAGMLVHVGRYADARRVCEAARKAGDADAGDIPVEQLASARLAEVLMAQGEHAKAVPVLRKALVGLTKDAYKYATGTAEAGQVRRSLLLAAKGAGKKDVLNAEIDALIAATKGELDNLVALSRRELGDATRRLAADLDVALSLSTDRKGPQAQSLFELLETVRGVSSTGLSIVDNPNAASDEVRELRRAVLKARQRIHEIRVAQEAARDRKAEDRTGVPTIEQLQDAYRARDRAEKKLKEKLGGVVHHVKLAKLGETLPRGSVAVSYYRYKKWTVAGKKIDSEDHYLAHIVKPGGKLERKELGRADDIKGLADGWRNTILGGVRGRAAAGKGKEFEKYGLKVRKAIFDGLGLASAKKIYLCPDGALHAVPFDAIPKGGAFMVDQHAFVQLPSLTHMTVDRSKKAAGARTLLAFGGINFFADLGDGPLAADARPAPSGRSRGRSGYDQVFGRLTQSKGEVLDLEAVFRTEFGNNGTSQIILGADATKAKFRELSAGAHYIHLATHGYFDKTNTASQEDAGAVNASWVRQEQTVRGFAPMTLCGLAFAGANAKKASKRVRGILTAEELAGMNLHSCELAVLSACESNVGINRAGQGLHSLQAALHAAGTRTAITSLWPVDDALTRKMIVKFYKLLWEEKKSKAEALRAAKKWLRDESGEKPEVKDWAAWVLTGDDK